MLELGKLYQSKVNYLASFYWYLLASLYGSQEGQEKSLIIIDEWQKTGRVMLATYIDGISDSETRNVLSLFRINAGLDRLDQRKINDLIDSAMNGDNEIACLFLARYFEGIGAVTNSTTCYKLAANNKSRIGMKLFADKLVNGTGCEQNAEAAIKWYKEAAIKGDSISALIYAKYCESFNHALAAYWYAVAFVGGQSQAIDNIKSLSVNTIPGDEYAKERDPIMESLSKIYELR